MVLLDKFAAKREDFVVAHFDHGIRPNSAQDAEFVRQLAAGYDVEFFLGRGKLGPNASEELARTKRYEFLKKVANDIKGKRAVIVTAHHQDDLIETALINLIRGTGWRGLAPMSGNVHRPLINLTKAEIVEYALARDLDWIEDETNFSHRYLRNRTRTLVVSMTPVQRQTIIDLCRQQATLRKQIEQELAQFQDESLLRYDLIMWPADTAVEILRQATDGRLTTPQLNQLLLFARTARPGKKMQFAGVKVLAKKRHISIDIC